ERGHVDDDAAARIGALAQANRQHAARNTEVFDRARQREGVRRNDANIALEIHERLLVELLGVDDGGVDVREDLELVGATDIVAIAAGAIADDTAAVGRADLARLERFDHAGLGRASDPAVAFNAHGECLFGLTDRYFSLCRPRA